MHLVSKINFPFAPQFAHCRWEAPGPVGAFQINGDGTLTPIAGGSGLPVGPSAQGIDAF